MRKLSATLPANLATTETSLTSTASAAPSFSRSTQFPLGFVSLMNIVSSAATTNGNSFPSASSIENNHSSGTPANTDQHNCVEGVKGANNKVEPLRRIPASVILAHRAPSLRTVPRPAPSCIDAFDDSRSFSLHCVSRTWCTEQGYDCSATSSTVFRQKPKRRSNGSVDVSKTQFISSNFLSSMRDCSSDLPASNNTRTVPDVRGPLKVSEQNFVREQLFESSQKSLFISKLRLLFCRKSLQCIWDSLLPASKKARSVLGCRKLYLRRNRRQF